MIFGIKSTLLQAEAPLPPAANLSVRESHKHMIPALG